MNATADSNRLREIEHVVVLTLENRSFDHMLGYLDLPEYELVPTGELPVAVNGLRAAKSNSHKGRSYPPHVMNEPEFRKQRIDPPHDESHVATQIDSNKMDGFVDALAASLLPRHPHLARDPIALQSVMGYMTPQDVPIFDHLARNFCVCDNWFCSLPGPTLPNRVYAVAGTSDSVMSDNDIVRHHFGRFHSFFRYLRPEARWRWYSSDPAILRIIDWQFTFDNSGEHFAYFDQYTEVQPRTFLRDVLGDADNKPDLPEVSWIDPNFNMKEIVAKWFPDGYGSDDDHPPSPVVMGQRLVNKIYTALGQSDYWDSTLLVVMYDEHGGFYDHQPPPEGLGPRIPVLLVSPLVQRGVCKEQFHHASIIKTILNRFGTPESISQMPPSVAAATDLSVALRTSGAVPYAPVTNPGDAVIGANDLKPAPLPQPGSMLDRTLDLADLAATDLQKLVVYGIALPLRSGWLFLRHAVRWHFLRYLVHLTRIRKPTTALEERRP